MKGQYQGKTKFRVSNGGSLRHLLRILQVMVGAPWAKNDGKVFHEKYTKSTFFNTNREAKWLKLRHNLNIFGTPVDCCNFLTDSMYYKYIPFWQTSA